MGLYDISSSLEHQAPNSLRFERTVVVGYEPLICHKALNMREIIDSVRAFT